MLNVEKIDKRVFIWDRVYKIICYLSTVILIDPPRLFFTHHTSFLYFTHFIYIAMLCLVRWYSVEEVIYACSGDRLYMAACVVVLLDKTFGRSED